MLRFRNTNEHKTQRAAFCECCANNIFTSNLLLDRPDIHTHTTAFLKLQPFNHKKFNSFVASSSKLRVLMMAGQSSVSSNGFSYSYIHQHTSCWPSPTKAKVKPMIPSLWYLYQTSRTKTWLLHRRRHRRRPPSKPKRTPPPSPASRKPRLRRLFSSMIKRQELNRWNHGVKISAGVKTETHGKLPSTSPETMNFQKTRSTGSQLIPEKQTGPEPVPPPPISPLTLAAARNTTGWNVWINCNSYIYLSSSG